MRILVGSTSIWLFRSSYPKTVLQVREAYDRGTSHPYPPHRKTLELIEGLLRYNQALPCIHYVGRTGVSQSSLTSKQYQAVHKVVSHAASITSLSKKAKLPTNHQTLVSPAP